MKKLYDIWLSSLDIKNNTKLNLLNSYSTEEIWNLNLEDFAECKVDKQDITKILQSKNLEDSKRMLDYMLNKNIKLISVKDKMYPIKLHNIEDKPAFLYVRGNEKILDEDSVRNCWV